MLCTDMALHHYTFLQVGGSQIQYIITSHKVVWLTGGQFLIRICGCARWCSVDFLQASTGILKYCNHL
jgi:hypothetical protein